MIVRFVTLLIVSVSVFGCAATGPTFSEDAASRPKSPDKIQVTIYRPGEYRQYSARAARLTLNNDVLGQVDYKGFNIFDIPPGQHSLIVDIWDAPGKCTIALDLEPDTDYYFQVLPRSASITSGLVGGLLGMAIESGGKECGGAFSIAPVAKETALEELQPLRLTKQ